jgi:hypothetical protein
MSKMEHLAGLLRDGDFVLTFRQECQKCRGHKRICVDDFLGINTTCPGCGGEGSVLVTVDSSSLEKIDRAGSKVAVSA